MSVHDALMVGAVPPADGSRHRGARLGARLEHKAVARQDACVCERHFAQGVLRMHVYPCKGGWCRLAGGGGGGGGFMGRALQLSSVLHGLQAASPHAAAFLTTSQADARAARPQGKAALSTCIVQHQLGPQAGQQRGQHLAQCLQ